MALYLVGDIQGCYQELRNLLKQVKFCPEHDQLWALGDLVARGDNSLETLRYLKSLGSSFNTVLGNHDLHLLAIYYGIRKNKKADHLDELLAAPDLHELIEWLRQKPLLLNIPETHAYLSHAGISPQWSLKKAIKNAKFAEKRLKSEKIKQWLTCMYGEQPNHWDDVTNKEERFRYTINAYTRMRYCYANGSLEFNCKQTPKNKPEHIYPWFENNTTLEKTEWIFGHWASLMGSCQLPNVYALDTGCVWGNHLTMLRWHDKKLFIEQSLQNR